MLIDCLKNILGFKGCGNNSFQLDLNQLHGFNIESASKITPKDQTAVEFINKQIEYAITQSNNDFLGKVQNNFVVSQFNEFIPYGLFSDYQNNAIAQNRGLSIRKDAAYIQKIYIPTIKIKVNNNITTNILIVDGFETTPVLVTLVANVENEITINYTAKTDSLFILIEDPTGLINSYTGDLPSINGCKSCGGNKGYKINDCNLIVKGWNGVTEDSKIYGIEAVITTVCNYDNIYCLLANQTNLKYVYLYKFGILFFKEYLTSDRLNEHTIYNKDKCLYLIENYEVEYQKQWDIFNESLKNFLNKISDNCLICRGLKYGYSL
jgi:hypothetical protein